MVAQLVRLKLTLLRNGLRRSVWQIVGLVFGVLYGLGAAAAVAAGLVALSTQDLALRTSVVVIAGSLLVLGWWVVPLVAFGVDATLDPERFAVFPLRRRDLLPGLTVAALVGVPGVVTLLLTLFAAVVWWREPLAALAAVVCGLVAVATCVVGGRALATVLAPLITRRRVREVVAALAIVPFILIGPTLSFLGSGDGTAVDVTDDGLSSVAGVLGWTPVGAAWAVPGDLAAGDWGRAVLRLLIALTTLALAAAVWDKALARALVNPRHDEGGGGRQHGLGWFGRVPATPLGAVVARCATYWVRDPRYALSVVVVPLIPVIFLGAGASDGLIAFLGPICAFLFAWSISADVAYDGTAFAMHVALPVRASTDRWGRIIPTAVLGVACLLVMAVVGAVLTDRLDLLPMSLGVGLGVLGTGLGVSSVLSALVVYPVAAAGENPFSSKQGGSAAAMASQLAGWSVTFALCLPEVGLGVAAAVTRSAALAWSAAGVGVVLGTVLLLVGVRIGSRTFERTAPELLTRVRSFR